MKWIMVFALAIFTGGVVIYISTLTYSECDTPLAYKLGVVDPNFGSDQTKVLGNLRDATDIWSKTYGKPLFINSPKAALTINFVYDERSALNTQIDKTQNQLNQKNTTLKSQIDAYETDVEVLKQKIIDFNARVDQINRTGGASTDVYKSIITEQQDLNAEGDTLNAQARRLNLASRNYNTDVQNLNQNISLYNQAITQKPEEGVYDSNTNTITIYFINSHDELVHTITHEFGHALGMSHTDDSESLMYPYTSSFLSVTPQDNQQLVYVCRQQPLLRHWLQKFDWPLSLPMN